MLGKSFLKNMQLAVIYSSITSKENDLGIDLLCSMLFTTDVN